MTPDEALTVLGLGRDALEPDIKQAYRDLAKVWHPDRFQEDPRLREKAEATFKEINAAFDALRGYRPPVNAARPSDTDTGPRAGEPVAQSPQPARKSAPRRPDGAVILLLVLSGILCVGLAGQTFLLGQWVGAGGAGSVPAGGFLPLLLLAFGVQKLSASIVRVAADWLPVRLAASRPVQIGLVLSALIVFGGSGILGIAVGRNVVPSGPSEGEAPVSPTGSEQSHAMRRAVPFAVGSSKEEVLAAQGSPTDASDAAWKYGESTVYSSRGIVVSWESSSANPLSARVAGGVAKSGYFALGASKDEVLVVQGPPTQQSEDVWMYGRSVVRFSRGVVVDWESSEANPLKARVIVK